MITLSDLPLRAIGVASDAHQLGNIHAEVVGTSLGKEGTRKGAFQKEAYEKGHSALNSADLDVDLGP